MIVAIGLNPVNSVNGSMRRVSEKSIQEKDDARVHVLDPRSLLVYKHAVYCRIICVAFIPGKRPFISVSHALLE